MNNKGFMMAEVVVVSAVILVTLTSLYISYGKILSMYNQRIDYYDIKTLYELAHIRDDISNELSSTGATPIKIEADESFQSPYLTINNKQLYYLRHNEINNLIENINSQTFIDYLNYLKESTTFETEYILIMERCIDTDNCKYAYLEVFE